MHFVSGAFRYLQVQYAIIFDSAVSPELIYTKMLIGECINRLHVDKEIY